jgi:hypothetical protein
MGTVGTGSGGTATRSGMGGARWAGGSLKIACSAIGSEAGAILADGASAVPGPGRRVPSRWSGAVV